MQFSGRVLAHQTLISVLSTGGKSRRSTVVKLGTVMHTCNLGRQMR